MNTVAMHGYRGLLRDKREKNPALPHFGFRRNLPHTAGFYMPAVKNKPKGLYESNP